MKLWWCIDYRRLADELATVDAVSGEGWFRLDRWHLVDHRLAADGTITVHGAEYAVRLVYPDQFPSVPAWVEPQDREARWSSHQYGAGGTLCLELRPDNWVPTASGGDVLRSAYNLLRVENPQGAGAREQVRSAHHISEIQAYDWGANPVFVRKGCLERIRSGSATDVRAIRWWSEDNTWPILLFDEIDASSQARPPEPDALMLRDAVPVCFSRSSPPARKPSSRRELAELCGIDLSSEPSSRPLLAIFVGADELVPFHSADDESAVQRKLIVLPDDLGARSGQGGLATSKQVAIVGLGSVGSKIADSLTRTGFAHLVLVDGDVMLPGNLERHTLDWRDVGFRKVNAVKRRLLQIRPSADVFVIAENLNWQRSSRHHSLTMDILASCDLIVDATGDAPTSLLLGAVAADSEKPFISVEVLEGGIGCIVARSIPGRDGTYAQGRAALLAYCDGVNVSPPKSGSRPYEALESDGTVVTADDAAVAVAAAHTARTAIDILRDEVDEGSPAWILFGLRKQWIFSGHGHTVCLEIPASTEDSTDEPSPEIERAVRLANRLIKESQSEAADST